MSLTRSESRLRPLSEIQAGRLPALEWFHPRPVHLRRWAALLVVWHQRRQQRNRLAELDDRLLQDIGKTRKAALDEAAKPFWRS